MEGLRSKKEGKTKEVVNMWVNLNKHYLPTDIYVKHRLLEHVYR